MIDISKIDYFQYDHPEITKYLFYPRKDWNSEKVDDAVESFLIPVAENITIGADIHKSGQKAATILFFHGNGEVVSDYRELGTLYIQMGINFLPVDYRGYGKSTGSPTVTAMMQDSHIIFDYVKKWLDDKHYTGSLIVMGRSLGSASALELASHYSDRIDGLIIESGFAHVRPLLQLIGVSMNIIGRGEGDAFQHTEKIRRYHKPTLIIHAEYDHVISFEQGKLLFDASPAKEKKLVKIPEANHNDIFSCGLSLYMKSVKWLVDKAVEAQTEAERV